MGLVSIARRTHPEQINWGRGDLVPVDDRNASADAGTGSDELDGHPDLGDHLHQRFALLCRKLGQIWQIAPQ